MNWYRFRVLLVVTAALRKQTQLATPSFVFQARSIWLETKHVDTRRRRRERTQTVRGDVKMSAVGAPRRP